MKQVKIVVIELDFRVGIITKDVFCLKVIEVATVMNLFLWHILLISLNTVFRYLPVDELYTLLVSVVVTVVDNIFSYID